MLINFYKINFYESWKGIIFFFKFYHLTLFVLTKKNMYIFLYVYMYYIGFLFTEFYFWLIVIQKNKKEILIIRTRSSSQIVPGSSIVFLRLNTK